jgi:carbamoyl-phosphate synthase/aspartate carbamoyltransferase/dihydroorotase
MLRFPGLIDPHVHVREPGATHKEDWDTATSAALAGGFTLVLAMPNTTPPIFDAGTLDLALDAAGNKARCDYAQFVGAGAENAASVPALAGKAAGLKMYLDLTYGQLRLDDMALWMPHFANWPKNAPLVVHAESRTMAAAILMAQIYDRPVHIAHVSLREEILLIKAAKQRGLKVTCEVTPHHLFLTKDSPPASPPPNTGDLGEGRGRGRREVRPRLAGQADVDALWENLDVIELRHRPRSAHPGREGRREPAARIPRARDRPPAAAHGPQRGAINHRSAYREDAHQSTADFQPAREARNVGRSGRRR